MARLPNAEKAIIEPEKLRDYILSPTHPAGQSKAAVFLKLGYSYESWEAFELNLRNLILSYSALEVEETGLGENLLLRGHLLVHLAEQYGLQRFGLYLKARVFRDL